MALSENIRFFRERAKMYQSDLGRILGVSAQAVSKWEVGKAEPDQESILKMCQLFECTANQLFGMEDIKKSIFLEQENYSETEISLVRAFRAADARAQEDAMNTLLAHPRDKKEENPA